MPMASFQDDNHKYNSLVIFFFLMYYLSNLIFDLQLCLPTSCIEADFFFWTWDAGRIPINVCRHRDKQCHRYWLFGVHLVMFQSWGGSQFPCGCWCLLKNEPKTFCSPSRIMSIPPWTSHRRLLACWLWTTCCISLSTIRMHTSG